MEQLYMSAGSRYHVRGLIGQAIDPVTVEVRYITVLGDLVVTVDAAPTIEHRVPWERARAMILDGLWVRQ